MTSGTTRPLVLANPLQVLHALRNGFQEDLANNLSRKVKLTACSYLDPPSCPSWGVVWWLPFSRHQGTSLTLINFPTQQRVALQWHWPVLPGRAGCIPNASMHLCTSSLLPVSLDSFPFTAGNTSLPQKGSWSWEAWEQPSLAKAEAKKISNTSASPITSGRQSSKATAVKRLSSKCSLINKQWCLA